MTDSKKSWELIPADSPPPSEEWLRFRVRTFLNIFYIKELSVIEDKALLADWCDQLRGFPQAAVDRAIHERIGENTRRDPRPGEIVARCREIIAKPEAAQAEDEETTPVISLERRREIARELGMPVFPKPRRM
jgi:hypothetical protein